LVQKLKDQIGAELADELVSAKQVTELDIGQQRMRVAELKNKLAGMNGGTDAKHLAALADYLVKKSVWILGGDGWAYDIGYGGLDHVLASGRNVNVLVLDTEVYSNTGGQASKATPRAAVAKFAAAGKPVPKKDLAQIIMTYRSVYVAAVASGANEVQTLRAFSEGEAYDGPSLIVAYSPCGAHGIDMTRQTDIQQLAVKSGHWPLFRYNPDLIAQGKNPLKLDSKAPELDYAEYAYAQVRFKTLTKSKPEEAAELLKLARRDVKARWHLLEQMSKTDYSMFKEG
jgi:pyruvate-ferredoxin/flavodoxin oxidoreductase